MKIMRQVGASRLITSLLAALCAVALGGCGKKGGSTVKPSAATNSQQTTGPGATPLTERVLTAWQQGDKDGAIQRFIETDWKNGLLFAPGSPLDHRESELQQMPQAELEELWAQVAAQLKDLKQIATAVRDKGRAAAAKDPAFAHLCFAKLDEFGAALDQPDGLKIVRFVGQSFRKMAAAEAARLANPRS